MENELAYNQLPINGWSLVLSRTPSVVFYAQELTTPNISFPEVEIPYPGNSPKFVGDRIEYSTVDITCIMDTELLAYKEIYNWMVSINVGGGVGGPGSYSDGVVTVRNGQSIPGPSFVYQDMFPVAISPMSFSTTSGTITYVTCTFTFAFTKMTIT